VDIQTKESEGKISNKKEDWILRHVHHTPGTRTKVKIDWRLSQTTNFLHLISAQSITLYLD